MGTNRRFLHISVPYITTTSSGTPGRVTVISFIELCYIYKISHNHDWQFLCDASVRVTLKDRARAGLQDETERASGDHATSPGTITQSLYISCTKVLYCYLEMTGWKNCEGMSCVADWG